MKSNPSEQTSRSDAHMTVWAKVGAEAQDWQGLPDDIKDSKFLWAVSFGLGGGLYPGLDSHDPSLRPLVDDSIRNLEDRIAKENTPNIV